MNDWSGKIAAGANTFKLEAVPDQEESVLGATSDLLKAGRVATADPSIQFSQFAKLDADQVEGDEASVCATIRDLAPTLTRDANQ